MSLRYPLGSENKTRISHKFKWRASISGQNLPDQNRDTNSGPGALAPGQSPTSSLVCSQDGDMAAAGSATERSVVSV